MPATARKIYVEAGLQKSIGDEHLAAITDLSAPVMRLEGETALGGVSANREFCEQIQADRVTDGAYVEIVSVISRIVNLDVLAANSASHHDHSQFRLKIENPCLSIPKKAVDEVFFTAPVPNLPAGGALAESIYGKSTAVNAFRAVSLVLKEGRSVVRRIEQ